MESCRRGLSNAPAYAIALDQDRTLNQVGVLGHEFQRLGTRRRILLHAAFAVKLVAGIQELFVVARTDQGIELRYGEALIQIDFFEGHSFFAKQTLRFAAA